MYENIKAKYKVFILNNYPDSVHDEYIKEVDNCLREDSAVRPQVLLEYVIPDQLTRQNRPLTDLEGWLDQEEYERLRYNIEELERRNGNFFYNRKGQIQQMSARYEQLQRILQQQAQDSSALNEALKNTRLYPYGSSGTGDINL